MPFIHRSFNNYYVLGTVLGPGYLRLGKIDMIPSSRSSCRERRESSKQNCNREYVSVLRQLPAHQTLATSPSSLDIPVKFPSLVWDTMITQARASCMLWRQGSEFRWRSTVISLDLVILGIFAGRVGGLAKGTRFIFVTSVICLWRKMMMPISKERGQIPMGTPVVMIVSRLKKKSRK